ncbi:MAG: hypothetical protein IJC45_07940 [Clostridia bacterium]|nr:hypothetical protein [Clostridia bacterium]
MDMVTYAALQKQMQEIGKDIAVPENVSAFANDAGYQTEAQVQTTVQTAADAVQAKIPVVPTLVSAFANDAQYQTEAQVGAVKAELEQKIAGKQATLTFDSVPTQDSENPVTSDGVYGAVADVIAVANGKCKSYVFDTVEALDAWLAVQENTEALKTGDVFLIRDVGVPDYWWDAGTGTKQILETTKVDLSDYALKTEIPKSVSQLNNDASYQTETQVQAKIAQTEAKIPVVPTNVSAFANDAGYALATAVEAALATKQNTLTFDSTPTAGSQNPVTSDGVKTAIDNAQNVFIVEFDVSLSANGLTLSLPSDVTFEDVSNAYTDNCHVLGVFEIPSAAGAMAGKYIAPLNKKQSDGSLLFVSADKSNMQWVQLSPDAQVSFAISRYEFTGNKVTAVSAASTDTQYPTAKAVYDFVVAQTGGLTFKVANTVPTVDDRSVITFVVEG